MSSSSAGGRETAGRSTSTNREGPDSADGPTRREGERVLGEGGGVKEWGVGGGRSARGVGEGDAGW
jgi:hypothetical protein